MNLPPGAGDDPRAPYNQPEPINYKCIRCGEDTGGEFDYCEDCQIEDYV